MRSYVDAHIVMSDPEELVRKKIVETLVYLHRHRKEQWQEGRTWQIAKHSFDPFMLEVGFVSIEWPQTEQAKMDVPLDLVEMARSVLAS